MLWLKKMTKFIDLLSGKGNNVTTFTREDLYTPMRKVGKDEYEGKSIEWVIRDANSRSQSRNR